jgi:glycosyltransferase involved in cell wall biosynthesis
MKILYLHQYFTTRQGASGARSYEFAKYLQRQGHEVTLLCGNCVNGDVPIDKRGLLYCLSEIDGINVIRIDVDYSPHMVFRRRMLAFLFFLLRASCYVVQSHRPDLILATSTPLTIAFPALVGFYLRKIPFVFEVRDLWPEVPVEMGILRTPFLKRMAYSLAKLAYVKASKIISLSPGISEGIKRYGIGAEKISLIPNASDIDLFHPEQVYPRIKQKLGIRDNQFVVGYFGAMGKANGMDVILDCAEILNRERPGYYVFLFAGDGPERPRLVRRAADAHLANILFVGQKARKEVPKYLGLSDVCLVTFARYKSLEANSPSKLFDALAAGKPVVVNKGGWMAELVEENGIGLALADCSARDLANGLEDLRLSPAVVTQMSHRARALAEGRFERLKLAEKMHRVLLEVG